MDRLEAKIDETKAQNIKSEKYFQIIIKGKKKRDYGGTPQSGSLMRYPD